MNKELLLHNMENMGGCDRRNLLVGLIYANQKDAEFLVKCLAKDEKAFSDHPGGGNDIDSLTYYAKRGEILEALLREVESSESLDYAGAKAISDLKQKYLESAKSEDLGDARKNWLVVMAKLTEAVSEKIDLDIAHFHYKMVNAKIKALINLL